jgi:hypothetical protein
VERAARFDLERAIEGWRAGFTQLSVSEQDELTAHLREEFARLEALGLARDEAWLLATRRLGSRTALEQEFEKLGGRSRVTTFLLGYLVVSLSLRAAGTIIDLAIAMSWGSGKWVSLAAGGTAVVIFGPLLVFGLRSLAQWAPQKLIRSPGWAFAAVTATYLGIGVILNLMSAWLVKPALMKETASMKPELIGQDIVFLRDAGSVAELALTGFVFAALYLSARSERVRASTPTK